MRGDVNPDDIAVSMAGIVLATISADPPQSGRLLDLRMTGGCSFCAQNVKQAGR